MTYKLIGFTSGYEELFQDWWELINHFYHSPEHLDALAHNDNDSWHAYTDQGLVRYQRNLKVVDADNRIINMAEIIEDLSVYQPRAKKYESWQERWYKKYPFRYRCDPVPHVGSGRWRYTGRNDNSNIRYASALSEYVTMFPSDGRMRTFIDSRKAWPDYYRHTSKSWKQKRVRKQWMKNMPNIYANIVICWA